MVSRNEPARAGDAGVAGSMARVLSDLAHARAVQDEATGVQARPDGTGDRPARQPSAQAAATAGRPAADEHRLTWRDLMAEAVGRAFSQTDPEQLRSALVAVGSLAVNWIQAIDRREGFVPQSMRYGGGERVKLVRDRVPHDWDAADGPAPAFRAVDEAEFRRLLRAKLHEEVGRYLAEADPRALADILEVVYALAGGHQVGADDLEKMRQAQLSAHGGYSERMVWPRSDPHLAELPPPPVIRQTVRALLLTAEDNLVLFRRTVPNREVYWITPGGAVEPGDPDPQLALRRELREELGATVGPLLQVLTVSDVGPQGRRRHTFYLCRLQTMDPSRRTGEEFADPSMGRYDVEQVPCDPVALGALYLRPIELAEYLARHAAQLPDLASSHG
jgi:ADP-ribose pyrophosphatase YjhB (NUDIX family)/predicted house-cleaning noncanonical NTP pyrophosphatase (MazG superfamily)